MNDDNNDVDIDLEEFESEFYGKTSPAPEKDEVDEPSEDQNEDEEVAETEDNPLAPDEDEDDEDVEEENEDDEEEVEEVPPPKHQKKNRAQERIEKLLERERLANERANALEKRLAALEAEKEGTQKNEEPKALRDQLPPEAPNPDAVDDKGEPLYPLGEFDPKFIRDLSKFAVAQEMAAAKEAAAREAAEKARQEQERAITEAWVERVEEVEKELPDLREKIADLSQTFSGIDPDYGEYLATAIMQSEVGPQIMYYLSQNIGEAQKIVASGPFAATLAIGRLEAKLSTPSTSQEEKRNTKQVSKAPEPPASVERARGLHGRFTVAPDTDDLNAFEREFFK